MEHYYFMVLELPGGEELKFKDGSKSPPGFWKKAAASIKRGKARIICKRQDTGVSEDLREHISNIKRFTTYVLVYMHLHKNEMVNRKEVFSKASSWLLNHKNETVIDTSNNFQLVTIEM